MIFLLIQIHPSLLESLWLSSNTPWGIVTSAFTHAQLDHLVSNLQGFTLSLLLFIPVSWVHPAGTRRSWSRVYCLAAFGSGIGANALEYPLVLGGPGFNSWGASGIVYGALGVLLAGCIWSLPAHLKALPKRRRRRVKWKLKLDRRFWMGLRSLMVLSLLISFLWLIFTDTGRFLSVGPGVDVLAHGFGFLIGLLGATVGFRFTGKRR